MTSPALASYRAEQSRGESGSWQYSSEVEITRNCKLKCCGDHVGVDSTEIKSCGRMSGILKSESEGKIISK